MQVPYVIKADVFKLNSQARINIRSKRSGLCKCNSN